MQNSIKLTIICNEKNIAQVLQSSTDPDNIDLPENLHITTIVKENIYEALIHHEGSILTLRSTVDDLLQQMDVSLNVIKN